MIMKYLIFIFVFGFVISASAQSPIKEDCTYNGIKLWGKVKIVENFEDFKVRIDDNFYDLAVEKTNFATSCGCWEIVDSFEDFTIRIVDSFEDFTIKFVDNFPGIN